MPNQSLGGHIGRNHDLVRISDKTARCRSGESVNSHHAEIMVQRSMAQVVKNMNVPKSGGQVSDELVFSGPFPPPPYSPNERSRGIEDGQFGKLRSHYDNAAPAVHGDS